MIQFYNVVKIRWGLITKDILLKEQDIEFNSVFNREPVKGSQDRRNMLGEGNRLTTDTDTVTAFEFEVPNTPSIKESLGNQI